MHFCSAVDPPQIVHAFSSETLQPGPPVHLMCVASGNPTPEISWELDGKKLTSRERIQVGQYLKMNGNGNVVSHLNISSIQTADGGLYKCIASSKVGSVEHAERLNVYGVPFIRPMDKRAIVSGETLIVTCPAAGYPIKSITWERGNFCCSHSAVSYLIILFHCRFINPTSALFISQMDVPFQSTANRKFSPMAP